METIGEKIKRLRKGKGLSLMDLSKILIISDAGLLKIETGKTKSITVDLGKKISKALDISFNELFDIEATPQNKDETESLISEIEGLKKQIDKLLKTSEKDEQIIDLLKKLQESTPQRIVNVFYYSLVLLTLEILSDQNYNEKEKELLGRTLATLKKDFVTELINNGLFKQNELDFIFEETKQLIDSELKNNFENASTKDSQMP